MHIDKLNMKTVYLQQQRLLFKMLVFVLKDKKIHSANIAAIRSTSTDTLC